MSANSGRRLLRSLLIPTLTGVAAAGKVLTVDSNKDVTGIRNLTITGTLVAPTQAETDATFTIVDDGDATKVVKFQVSGNTTGITTTIASQSTGAATITLPAATSTLATLAGTETLSGKTLTDPIVTNVKRCTSQKDTITTALADITGLTAQTLVAGATYKFRCVLPGLCDTTSGVAYAFNFTTASLTSIDYTALAYTASAVAVTHGTTTTNQTLMADLTGVRIMTIIEGSMVVNAGGTVALQVSTHTGTTTASVYAGATMEFTRIA